MMSGIWLPIVTPFKDGQVDLDGLQRLADHYLHQEISGFVALGTTGEAALLDQNERLSVLQALQEVVGTRLTIVAGIGGVNTQDMVREMHRLERWDVGGYLVSAPAYIRPDQQGIQWHFEQVAKATDRPVILYDVPHRTGVSIAPQTVARLIEHANVVGVKACVPESFRALCRLPVSVLCGNDEAFVDCLLAGGAGGILASAHLFADTLAEIQELGTTGRIDEAFALFDSLLPVIGLLFASPNPSAIKGALESGGMISRETRLPIVQATDDRVEQLRQALVASTHARAIHA